MTEPLFTPRREHGSALDQLANLRNLARRTPAEAPVVEAAVQAVETSPVEAFAAGAQAEAPAAAQVATEFTPAPVVAEAANADQAMAAAAGQVVDVHVQPRIVVPGAEQVIVPVDVVAPAAQPRVTVAAPQTVYVDRATGQVIAAPVAAEAAVETAPRAGFRSWSAQDIGNLFGGRGAPAAAADAPVVAAVPEGAVVGEAAAVAEGAAKPSLMDQLRGAFTGARGTTPAAAPVAGEAAAEVVEAAGRPSLMDQLRAAGGTLRGPAAPAAGEAAAEVVDAAVPAVAKPSFMDQLRGAAGQLRGPAAAGAGEVAAEAAPAAPKGLAAIREGLSGLGALRNAPVREAVEEAVEHAPSLADRALDALRIASKVK